MSAAAPMGAGVGAPLAGDGVAVPPAAGAVVDCAPPPGNGTATGGALPPVAAEELPPVDAVAAPADDGAKPAIATPVKPVGICNWGLM